MRKTSHDGTDATSITSGFENEIKKAGANISKIKKSSIKRKVQNLSHDSDEGIIEPLLQIEKEKAEIASRSAKFLLNKSKTDSSYERINKSSDSFAFSGSNISTPPSSASKVTSDTVKESQSSTSHICGTTRNHNHMNVNVFSTFDVSKSIPTTKNQVLVEIDGCKSGGYNPSPLIFTTAKIHTDSKSKLMEPVQTTPVPILSTIEGKFIKALSGEHHINSVTNKKDTLTSTKEANELQSAKEKAQHILTTVPTVSSNEDKISSKGVSNLNECINKNLNEQEAINVLKNTLGTCIKSQNPGQFTNYGNRTISSTTTNSSIIKNNDSSANQFSTEATPISTNSLKETSMSCIKQTTLNEKSISYDKNAMLSSENKIQKSTMQPLNLQIADNKSIDVITTKESYYDMSNNLKSSNKITSPIDKLVNEEMPQTLKLKESLLDNKRDNSNIVKSPTSNASKKLQRQKNAAVDDINEASTNSSSISVEKSKIHDRKIITNNDKATSSKGDYKRDGTPSIENSSNICIKSSPIIETRQYAKPATLQKSTEDASCKPKIKSTIDVTHIKPVTCSKLEDVTTTQTKSSIISIAPSTKDNTKSTSMATTKSQSSSTASVGNTSVMATFSKPEKSSNCTVVPTTSKCISPVKCDSTTATSLPLYIVSTSKTKIGGTFTTNTLNTTKPTTQKSFAEIIYTSSSNETEKMAKTTLNDDSKINRPSSSSANHSNISQETKTKASTSFKDGRA